ncbi:hypothetical protein FIE12Z_12429 [Fusarium flagelliforme]|uniref:Transcription factor domain-containing protein n=1 Tax=Fusarium flagelliforme TaxID=2675880 RepID=A0A395M8F4_9HYPO|nr:hypothetical protein FIE12Z_12429 [Fusarium flagelliforme]
MSYNARLTLILGRGSRCLDQRDVSPVDRGPISDESASFREGAIALESMVKHHAQVSRDPALDFQALDLADEPVEADTRVPFICLLNNVVGSMEGHLQLPASVHNTATYKIQPLYTQSTSHVCSKLRSALPEYDVLMSTLSRNGAWWSSFRHKTQAICQGPYEDLTTFAARAYTSSIPAEVGMLVAAYARSTSQHHHLYEFIESLSIPSSTQSYSAEDLELLLLLAKAYSDIGQPRKSWIMYRKGLTIAEVMGLYRREMDSPRLKGIWWAFYHGDRFASLLLGLPYGFNDAHFGPSIEHATPENRFILRCAFIAGKVIDRNLIPGKPSSASSMLLDEQMDTITSSMHSSWWDPPSPLPTSDSEIDTLRSRLLLQFYFFHIRINLHLSFIARSELTSPRDSHRLVCSEASRQLLKRFLLLSSRVGGANIFDCKTTAFVAFMAAVALILTLSPTTTPISNEDRNLIPLVKGIFDREEKEGCKIAGQCRKMLDMLLGIPLYNDEASSGRLPEKVLIPYFGYIHRDLTRHAVFADLKDQAIGITNVSSDGISELGIESGSNSLPETMETQMCWEFGGLEQFQVDDLSSWLDTAMLDINQECDVSWGEFFINDLTTEAFSYVPDSNS